jgi:hypothetical protein
MKQHWANEKQLGKPQENCGSITTMFLDPGRELGIAPCGIIGVVDFRYWVII